MHQYGSCICKTEIMKQMGEMLLLPEMAPGEVFSNGKDDCFTALVVTGNWTLHGCSFTKFVSFRSSEGRRLLGDLNPADEMMEPS